MKPVMKHNGFTLIEIMVAVAVLSIIASIAIPAYNSYISTARESEGAQDMAALRIAQEEFFMDNNTYFQGATAGALRAASGNLWEPANWNPALADAVNEANLNFSFVVVPGPTGIQTSYNAIATGQNDVKNTVVINVTEQNN